MTNATSTLLKTLPRETIQIELEDAGPYEVATLLETIFKVGDQLGVEGRVINFTDAEPDGRDWHATFCESFETYAYNKDDPDWMDEFQAML